MPNPPPPSHTVLDLERVLDQSGGILVAHTRVGDNIVVCHLIKRHWFDRVTKITKVRVLVKRNLFIIFLNVFFEFFQIIA